MPVNWLWYLLRIVNISYTKVSGSFCGGLNKSYFVLFPYYHASDMRSERADLNQEEHALLIRPATERAASMRYIDSAEPHIESVASRRICSASLFAFSRSLKISSKWRQQIVDLTR